MTQDIKNLDKFSVQKCSRCPGTICCTYFTEHLDTPRSKIDFDHLLWQISHKNIEIYKDEEGWLLLVNEPCSHLLADGACGIYDVRFRVCRTYSDDWCEMDEPANQHFELYFKNYYELLEYCQKRFKTWEQ